MTEVLKNSSTINTSQEYACVDYQQLAKDKKDQSDPVDEQEVIRTCK